MQVSVSAQSVLCKNLQSCYFIQVIVYEMFVFHVFGDTFTGDKHCFFGIWLLAFPLVCIHSVTIQTSAFGFLHFFLFLYTVYSKFGAGPFP